MTDLMTADEHAAMDLLVSLVRVLRKITGDNGYNSDNDRAEWVYKIHDLQSLVMSQAAARAYPERYRLLGATLNG